ncbi:condensin-2 complex subunit H2 isoform X2 [Conger conger]|uniref:condensin-2 complex subunit H2 isoform X2 n=1 Tax=Conger conger TaxID=82655 RepID=UPI002A5ABBBB|nr:condensin-2 complex subunit H2 isoform X2 [Conger conger]
MDVAETRFTHLLQPIRDLTKNWEVDVASQLGEYLDELDQICISFDEGNTTMNFAEAALLIQGSACIYSKKVEYLYSLVYQALDFISNKKRDKQPTSIEPDGRDKDATFGHKKDKVEFLSLDDFSETNSANVELRNDNAKGLEIVPLTPEPLIPVEVEEKKKNPLLSHKGEVLASCRDFRMNTFTPRANGLIRLDLISTPSMFVKDIRLYMQDNLVASPIVGLEDANPQNTPLPPLNLSEGPDEGGVMPGAAGAGDLPEAFLPLEGDEGMELDPGTDEHICRQQAPSERRMLRERPAERAGLQPEDIPDPWRCHNPFSTPLPDKPLKIGKHFTIPPGVQEVTGNKRKRRGTVKLPAFMDWFTKTSSDRPSRRTKKGPTFPDMEDLYWNNVREKLKILKRFQRRAGVLVCDVPGQRNLDQWGSEEQQQDEGLDEQPDDFQDPDGGGGDFSDHENPAEIADDRDLVITASQTERMSYEDLVKRSVELFLVNSRKYEQETVLSRRMKDWEEMIGPQLSTQEGQLAFDIHDYGNKIMAAFSDVAERRTFASIVRGKESHEVCRYMLASLQLANDHTVEIHRGEGLEEAIDTMALTLLTNQKAHERFKTYTAPSVTNAS